MKVLFKTIELSVEIIADKKTEQHPSGCTILFCLFKLKK